MLDIKLISMSSFNCLAVVAKKFPQEASTEVKNRGQTEFLYTWTLEKIAVDPSSKDTR